MDMSASLKIRHTHDKAMYELGFRSRLRSGRPSYIDRVLTKGVYTLVRD